MSRYEKLHAWRECHELALTVYRVTKKFPDDERYGLTSQTRRAAFSAAVNIVEGSARRSTKEFRRFLDISLSSLSEVGYALRFAHEAGLLAPLPPSRRRFPVHERPSPPPRRPLRAREVRAPGGTGSRRVVERHGPLRRAARAERVAGRILPACVRRVRR